MARTATSRNPIVQLRAVPTRSSSSRWLACSPSRNPTVQNLAACQAAEAWAPETRGISLRPHPRAPLSRLVGQEKNGSAARLLGEAGPRGCFQAPRGPAGHRRSQGVAFGPPGLCFSCQRASGSCGLVAGLAPPSPSRHRLPGFCWTASRPTFRDGPVSSGVAAEGRSSGMLGLRLGRTTLRKIWIPSNKSETTCVLVGKARCRGLRVAGAGGRMHGA